MFFPVRSEGSRHSLGAGQYARANTAASEASALEHGRPLQKARLHPFEPRRDVGRKMIDRDRLLRARAFSRRQLLGARSMRSVPVLARPSDDLHASFLEALDAFRAEGRLGPDDSTGLAHETRGVPALDDPIGFAQYVAGLRARALPETPQAPGCVPDIILWLREGNFFIGRLSIRHELSEELREIGRFGGRAPRQAALLGGCRLAESGGLTRPSPGECRPRPSWRGSAVARGHLLRCSRSQSSPVPRSSSTLRWGSRGWWGAVRACLGSLARMNSSPRRRHRNE